MINERRKKWENIFLSALCIGALFLYFSIRFDFYFDLNDDLLIRDILSGIYTGEPEGHTHQMLYFLGRVLAFCYTLFPKLPVFSLFLTGSLIFSCFLILYGSLSCLKSSIKEGKRAVFALGMTVCGTVLFAREFVLVQYTAVSGILCAASCFWLIVKIEKNEKKILCKEYIPALAAYLLAFCIRTEMALLCLPFLFLSLWSCYRTERRKNYGIFLFLLFFGCLFFLLADYLAYRGEEWKKFSEFFDARTEVYDYTWYPAYEEAEEFYQEKEISQVQYELIRTYNFGLDDEITETTLSNIAEYKERERHSGGVITKSKETAKNLLFYSFRETELPYNLFVIGAYLFIIIMAVREKNIKKYGIQLFLLWMVRSLCWGYLFWSQRLVERVTHPLYMIEFFFLTGFLMKKLKEQEMKKAEEKFPSFGGIVFLSFLFLSLSLGIRADRKLQIEVESRKMAAEVKRELEEYTRLHGENYYYLDVYSMVNFTDKMYDTVNHEKRNYDFLGGWISKSPLEIKARKEAFGEEISLEEALLRDKFYLIGNERFDTEIIKDYYSEKRNIDVTVKQTDIIGEGIFYVYQLVR